MMDPNLKAGLMWRAKSIIERFGFERLINYRHNFDACGCMGPRHDEPLCNCKMWGELEKNWRVISQEIRQQEKVSKS
jgi:hypothetical protein